MRPSWIECARRSSRVNLPVRIRADFVTMVLETLTKEGDKYIPGVRIHLGNSNHIDVVEETMETVWNKLSVAMGAAPTVVSALSPEWPGHPDYGTKAAA